MRSLQQKDTGVDWIIFDMVKKFKVALTGCEGVLRKVTDVQKLPKTYFVQVWVVFGLLHKFKCVLYTLPELYWIDRNYNQISSAHNYKEQYSKKHLYLKK